MREIAVGPGRLLPGRFGTSEQTWSKHRTTRPSNGVALVSWPSVGSRDGPAVHRQGVNGREPHVASATTEELRISIAAPRLQLGIVADGGNRQYWQGACPAGRCSQARWLSVMPR